MKDLENGFETNADELIQVLYAASRALMNDENRATDNFYYYGVLMGMAASVIQSMRENGAENVPIELEAKTLDEDN